MQSHPPIEPREPSGLALIAEYGDGGRQPLSDGKFTLGRGSGNLIPINEPEVSRRHARLTVSRGRLTVTDLGSINGTFVNERRIEQPTPLVPGDRVRVGSATFRLEGPRRLQILILGGGFAGIYSALALQRQLKRRGDVEVSLVSRDNFFLFQPMLPEIVSGSIETQHILSPIRSLCPDATFYTADVEGIEIANRQVTINTGHENRLETLRYDFLVLALGSIIDLSRFPGLAEHALLAKTLGDAFFLRNHILDMLEKADAENDSDERLRLLTFVVAGGGFSGVEVMAEMADLIHEAVRRYRNLRRGDVRLVLLQGADRILPEVNESLAGFATRKLADKGIEVLLRTRLSALTPDEAVLDDGSRIPTRTLVATIGNAPHPLLATLPCQHDQRGALLANAYCEVEGLPSVWAIGDNASIPDLTAGGEPCPPTAQYAIRQGATTARNIVATIEGRPKHLFLFGGLGQLASLGRGSAVAEVFGLKLSGFIAWWLWRLVYLSKLPSMNRKIHVLTDWFLDMFLERDTVRLQVERTESVQRMHFEAGQVIIQQGDVGTRFYTIETGSVEVVRESHGGDERLATLGPGEHFGEVALVGGSRTRRSATVRALSPVDLLSIERADFLALMTHGLLQANGARAPSSSLGEQGAPPSSNASGN